MTKKSKSSAQNPKILLLDANNQRQNKTKQMLSALEAHINTFVGAKKAYRYLKAEVPDLMIMTAQLSDEDPVTFCRDFRRLYPWVPIIVIHTDNNVSERVALLDGGADDCLLEPLEKEEFLARVRRALKRFNELFDYYQMERTSCELDEIGLSMNPDKWEARFKNIIMDLSKTEFKLMELFCQHPNETLPRSVLVQKVWRAKPPSSPRTIDNFVMRLRKKLNQAIAETKNPDNSVQLITIHGLGYHLKVKQLRTVNRKGAVNE